MTDVSTISLEHAAEIERGERFGFGENWANFLRHLDEDRIAAAERSVRELVGVDLAGRSFLDVGSGSGLFSLAARRLGADVTSFDYDPQSVACTRTLRERFFPGDEEWRVEQGSALDRDYLETLGRFDVVYSWGVLHHTGAMWAALDNVSRLVKPGGTLVVAIYQDQGAWSERWTRIKHLYCASGPVGRAAIIGTHLAWNVGRNLLADLVWMRNPLRRYASYRDGRGMSFYHDVKDWLGGYPFEVAKPEQVFDFYEQRGFRLRHLHTERGTQGCNEFRFTREA